MSPYMYRATHTLSGGQRQRVAIAGVPQQPLNTCASTLPQEVCSSSLSAFASTLSQ